MFGSRSLLFVAAELKNCPSSDSH